MSGFQLHLISDHAALPPDGVDYLQVRLKGAPAAEVYGVALAARRDGVGLVVNDRVDVALAVDAVGVHLARKSLPPAVVRRLLGPKRVMGVSVHSVEEAREAAARGADYVTFGHVFASRSKPGMPPRGVLELAAVVQAVGVPVLAIGGVGPDNLAAVLRTGCAGVAVISAVWGAVDPRSAVSDLRARLDAYPGRPRHALQPGPSAARVRAGGDGERD